MSTDAIAVFDRGERCVVCGEQVGTLEVVVLLKTTWTPASWFEAEDLECGTDDMLISSDWSEQKLAHVLCMQKLLQEA